MHAARDRRVGPQGRPEQAVGPLERPHELLQDRALWPSWGTVEREASGGDELLQCSHGHRRHIGAGKKEVVDVPVHVGACGRCAAVRFARLDAPQRVTATPKSPRALTALTATRQKHIHRTRVSSLSKPVLFQTLTGLVASTQEACAVATGRKEGRKPSLVRAVQAANQMSVFR